MLVMKTDGNKATFQYSSSLWSSQTGLNPSAYATGLDNTEYQSQLYWQMPFTSILLGMRLYSNQGTVNFVTGSYSASSLYAVIAPGGSSGISISRSAWEGLATGGGYTGS